MAGKGYVYYLHKTARISGWALLVITAVFIITGYSLCGEFGVDQLIDSQTALSVHQFFDLPLVALFVVHSAATIYLAFMRWGWVGK